MNELEQKFTAFIATGKLDIALVMNANSAVNYFQTVAEKGLAPTLRREYVEAFERHAAVYREVAAQFEQIDDAARLTEIAVWFGRSDRADAETVKASRAFSRSWWPSRPGEPEPNFGLTPGDWAIQTYYREATTTAHSLATKRLKALLMGSAGRVLLTVRDSQEGNGPAITLIFDEDSKHPRGGIQSLFGTKIECLELLKLLRAEHPLTFKPDKDVSFG